MIFAFTFLILRIVGIVNTRYDWLIFALLIIADMVSEVPQKIIEVVRE